MIDFVGHSEIEVFNNLPVNSMRPVAVRRKNWVSIGSVNAGPLVAAVL